MNYSPLKLVLILANTEGKFNFIFLGSRQRRLIFSIKKIPTFRVLDPHSKHCQGHIAGQTVEKNVAGESEMQEVCLDVEW